MNDYDFSSLAEGLKSFNIEVNERQIEQFLQYYEFRLQRRASISFQKFLIPFGRSDDHAFQTLNLLPDQTLFLKHILILLSGNKPSLKAGFKNFRGFSGRYIGSYGLSGTV